MTKYVPPKGDTRVVRFRAVSAGFWVRFGSFG
jgi:hypothetical protein